MRQSRSPPPEEGDGSATAGLGGRKRTATEIFSMGGGETGGGCFAAAGFEIGSRVSGGWARRKKQGRLRRCLCESNDG
jgi:hypothetical protein